MDADPGNLHPVGFLGPQQHKEGHDRRQYLGQDRGDPHACHCHIQDHHEEKVQDDIDAAGGNEEIKGAAGISDGPEDAGSHVVDHGGDHTEKIDPHVGDGVCHDILRRIQETQGPGCGNKTQDHHQGAAQDGKGHGGVDGQLQTLMVAGAVILRDHHPGAGGKPHEKSHQEIDDGGGGTTYCGQGLLSHKITYDHRIGGVVQLLKKGPEKDRKKEDQKLLPDNALRDLIDGLTSCFFPNFLHVSSSPVLRSAPE